MWLSSWHTIERFRQQEAADFVLNLKYQYQWILYQIFNKEKKFSNFNYSLFNLGAILFAWKSSEGLIDYAFTLLVKLAFQIVLHFGVLSVL